ncbi:MAG TPA: hypothetical protein VE843_09440 [Ktedonobacteraceae bacterium]|nr:hypothetical protein [Ktedonobacteraceae bacterium]
MASQTSGSCAVARTAVFSHVPFLRASYTSNQADADGRCHNANYWAVTQILSPDVDTANSIAMVRPAALWATKHAAFDLAAHTVTVRAGTAY